ncbi:hypothetical protein SAMN05216390_1485 [Lachnospiraceae bacterium KH1T2]|nr:hypothetical protein SAMN05216390_1485 [Lachnospiraceae bacterium KH1T2]
MLKLPCQYYQSEECNTIVARHVNKILSEMLASYINSVVENITFPVGGNIERAFRFDRLPNSYLDAKPIIKKGILTKEAFSGKSLFPPKMPDVMKTDVITGLYSLLKSHKIYPPTIDMQYLLYNIVELGSTVYEDEFSEKFISGTGDTWKWPEVKDDDDGYYSDDDIQYLAYRYSLVCVERFQHPERSKLINTLIDEKVALRNKIYAYDKFDEWNALSDREKRIKVRKVVRLIIDELEHPCEKWLKETVFEDFNFKILDEKTPGQLRGTKMNKRLKIVPEQPESYSIPSDWKTSKQFHYEK